MLIPHLQNNHVLLDRILNTIEMAVQSQLRGVSGVNGFDPVTGQAHESRVQYAQPARTKEQIINSTPAQERQRLLEISRERAARSAEDPATQIPVTPLTPRRQQIKPASKLPWT